MRLSRGVFAPLAATAFVASAIRFLYWRELRTHSGFVEPVLDGAANLAWAKGLLAGTWPGEEPFFRAPAYVVALAGLLSAAGGDVERVIAMQIALGVVTPVLTALIAGRLFGNAAAWIAGLGAAVYPTLLFLDGQLLGTFLAVPAFAAAVLAGISAREHGGVKAAAIAGLLFGVAGGAWPPILLAGLWLVGSLFRAGHRAAALAAAVTLSIVPLAATVHNVSVGDPAFLATQGGLNAYLGNRPGADGMSATFAEAPTALGYRMMEAATQLAERREGRSLRASEVSAHYVRRTIDGIREDPAAWLRLVAKKKWLSLSAREIPNNHDFALFREEMRTLAFPGWALWAPLCAAGLWMGRRRSDVRWLAAGVAVTLLGCIAFFVTERFRAPAIPLVVALGAGGVVALADAVRRRQARALVGGAGIAALVAFFALWNPYKVPAKPWVLSYVLVAEAERDRGELVRSLRWIDRALEESPRLYTAQLARVELLRRMSRFAEARTAVDAALADLPEDAALLHERAILLDLTGETAAALAGVEQALARDPKLESAHITRAIVLARLGRAEEASHSLRAFLARSPSPPEAARAQSVLEGIARGELAPRAD